MAPSAAVPDPTEKDFPALALVPSTGHRWLALLVWGYVLGLAGVAAAMYAAGDRWWLATLILYAPRWFAALPLALLLPLVLWLRPRLLWLLLAAGLMLLGPIMGGRISVWPGTMPAAGRLRVLTCNVEAGSLDPARFQQLFEQIAPDLVALQEYRRLDPDLSWPANWHVERHRGLLIASRFPLQEVQVAENEHVRSQPTDALACSVMMPQGAMRIITVHLRSPQQGIRQVLDRKTVLRPEQRDRLEQETELRRRESASLRKWLGPLETVPAIVLGDFNLTVESTIYRRYWNHLNNAFSRAGWGFGYTKQTPLFGIEFGTRIDHILHNAQLKTIRCWVGPDVGADHLPLIADLAVQESFSPPRPE